MIQMCDCKLYKFFFITIIYTIFTISAGLAFHFSTDDVEKKIWLSILMFLIGYFIDNDAIQLLKKYLSHSTNQEHENLAEKINDK